MAKEKEAQADFNKTMTRIAKELAQSDTRGEQAAAAAKSLSAAQDTISRAVKSNFRDRTAGK